MTDLSKTTVAPPFGKPTENPEQAGFSAVDGSWISGNVGSYYTPESWSMLKDSIYAAQAALSSGIEYTAELLAKHDRDLGREHRSNRLTAERMERDLEQMRKALDGLHEPNGAPYSTNTKPMNLGATEAAAERKTS